MPFFFFCYQNTYVYCTFSLFDSSLVTFPQSAIYALHLQHPVVTLHPRCLHGHLVSPNPATPPCRRRPSLVASARRRFAYSPCASAAENPHPNSHDEPRPQGEFWANWAVEGAEMRARVAKLGLAAVLAYGLFDAVTYTAFFILAFLGYEKSTGKDPAANIKALLAIVILMWTGNNVTRPFRVAGAAALAPAIARGLKGIQEKFNLPSQMYAFALVVGSMAVVCLTVVSFLILSKWGK